MTGLSIYLQEHTALTLFLICHFLSDFHLQSQTVADRKDTERIYLLKHLAGVAFPLIIVILGVPRLVLPAVFILLSHGLIDFLKPKAAEGLGLNPAVTFTLDQAAHIGIILFLGQIAEQSISINWLRPQLLLIILFLLLITKPTNIAFRIFFQKYQPRLNSDMDTIAGAGGTIGYLERIIIGICLLFGQFASIGLVFTAKSIARYNKISENPAFAEYYLIGSLFSILSVLAAAWICLF
ncbi:DUF3307 domain-containing protein [Streptococcus dentiloxodontae]